MILCGEEVREYVQTNSRTDETIVWYDQPEKFPQGKRLEIKVSRGSLSEARQKAEKLWPTI